MLNICHGRRDLVIALVGRMVSTFGDGVALVALTLRLQADGAHPYEVGLLLAAGVIPQLLLARPIGRLVDAHDSRRLLVAGGLVEVAATIPLVFLHSVVPIVILVAVLGAAASMTGATWSALIPRVVGEDHLAEAVSAQTVPERPRPRRRPRRRRAAGRSVRLGRAGDHRRRHVRGRDRRRRPRPHPSGARAAPAVDGASRARGGFAILRADRVLAPLLAGVALVVLLVGMVDVVLVYLVRDTLHAGGVWYGVAEASWMAGMVAGSLGAGRVGTETWQVRATIAGAALACAGVAGFAVAPAVGILVPLSVLGGVGNGYAGTCLSTLLMARTPDSARGRVSAAANAVFGGAQGASLLLGGVVAVVLSPRTIYAVAGVLGLAAAGLVAVSGASGTSSRATPADASAG